MVITEYMPRGNLESLLQNKNNMNNNTFHRLRIAKQVAKAMEWLHSSEHVFLHGNLNPSNILVDDNYNIKICDYGTSSYHNYLYQHHFSSQLQPSIPVI